MNITFIFLSIFGILAGLIGHATSQSSAATASDSTVDPATPTVSTDTSSPSADGSSSAPTADSASTASGSTADPATPTVSTDTSSPSAVGSSSSSSSSGGDSSSGTTAESNTASDMSGTTTADSASTAEADNCYSLTHSCEETTNLSQCFEDFRRSQSFDTCPRNGKYCRVKGTVKDNTTTIEADCVETSCDHDDYTTDAEGHVTLNCCSSALCNEERLLYAGSASLRGVLPLVLLAAVAAVAVGASTAGTNIVV